VAGGFIGDHLIGILDELGADMRIFVYGPNIKRKVVGIAKKYYYPYR
jgi:hypothetical protein